MKIVKCSIYLTILLCLSTSVEADEITDCLAIDSNLARLDCYDSIARRRVSAAAQESGFDTAAKPRKATLGKKSKKSEQSSVSQTTIEETSTTREVTKAAEKEEGFLSRFGKKIKKPKTDRQSVSSRVTSVRKSPMGNHILGLANGQTWVENEPGRRSIKAEQSITVTKKLLSFEMQLESGRRVAVHRID